ncbi:MAG: AraC family transcriptional regulator [Pseudomonadales bacterium]
MTKNSENKTKSVHIRDHWTSVEGKPLAPDAEPDRRIIMRTTRCNSSQLVPMHAHARGQLLFLTEGLVEAKTRDASTWIVPTQRAVWLPPFVEHQIRVIHAVEMRNVYIAPDAAQHLPQHCQVINVSPLLRELIIALSQLPLLYDEEGAEGRLVDVFLDQLHSCDEAPLHLPMPSSPALLDIARRILAAPHRQYAMPFWERELGISSRTLARKFNRETAMTYSQWRQQAKLLAALTRIAQGDAVANIAQDLGYQSQSAFISMFKKALGKTPGQYFQ